MTYKQQAPFCIQVEPTEGCNLSCDFCGIYAIRTKEQGQWHQYKFMTVETAREIGRKVKAAGWKPRVEFAMHGEPTLNPDLPRIVKALRKRLPNSYFLITSNGVPLIKGDSKDKYENFVHNVGKLFRMGINRIAIDNYVYLHDKVANVARQATEHWDVYEYPENKDGNPHRQIKGNAITIVKDISVATQGSHSHLSNSAGNSHPPDLEKAMGKRCALPFREIAFRWDGKVALCCNDWRGKFKIGDIHEVETIEEIWHHPAMEAARKKLYHGERDFGACYGCTHYSNRVGLLPDKFGKETLPKATAKDMKQIEKALSGDTMTIPILRPWEKEKAKTVATT